MNARDAVLPEHLIDDAALLLARTHALDPQHVADWDVEDPAQVPHARKFTLDQLEAWVLEEASFVTELVVSELVTNAIRYGEPPIRLRLIRDTSLICEVSDASNTAPHLRRARAFDEGGRGLLLVAQLTQGWGPGTPPTARRSGAHRPSPNPSRDEIRPRRAVAGLPAGRRRPARQ